MALSGNALSKTRVGRADAAPAATYARTTAIDGGTKAAAAGGACGTYGPALAGPGITQAGGGAPRIGSGTLGGGH